MKSVYFAVVMTIQLVLSNLVMAAPPGVNGKAQTLILTIENYMGAYQVLDAQVVDGDVPPRKVMDKQEVELLFYLKDQHGFVLGQGESGISHGIRGILEEGSEHAHGEYQQEKTVFVLRYPYEKGMEIVSLIEKSDGPVARSAGAVPAQQLDFSGLLKTNP